MSIFKKIILGVGLLFLGGLASIPFFAMSARTDSSPSYSLSNGADISNFGESLTTDKLRLVGQDFKGSVIDTNYWSTSTNQFATTSISNGVWTLNSSANAYGSSTLVSNQSARFLADSMNKFHSVLQISTTTEAKNIKQWGAYNGTDGAYFQFSTTTFSVCTLKTAVATCVDSGSFNGNYGLSKNIDIKAHTYEISYDLKYVTFYVDGIILHSIVASTASWTDNLDLPARFYNGNNASSTTGNVTMTIRGAGIYRYGNETEQPIWYNTAGVVDQALPTVLKKGAGTLHRIIVNDNVGTLTLANSATGTSYVISTIDLTAVVGSIEFMIPFSNGLVASTTGAAQVTIIYE
jgi:hypothetical protein